MSVAVRNPSAPGDYVAAISVMSTAFLERPEVERVAEQVGRHWAPERTWIAWDASTACGTFRSWATELTLPGGRVLPAAAVSAVSVLPTHRRRGVLTRMADAAHRGIVAAGEPLAILHSSEYPIYGRFGYAPATRAASLTVRPRAAAVAGEAAGSMELAPPSPTTRDAAREVFDAARLRVAGEIRRGNVAWDIQTGLEPDAWEGKRWSGFIALHRDALGSVDGYVRYRADAKWEHGPTGELTVEDLHALNPTAYADLWRYLLSVDLVTSVRAANRPVDEPLPWLLANARAVDTDRVSDQLWVRILDLPRALEARSFEREGSITLEVVDDDAWGGTRRWRLDAGPDGAACRPTASGPDLTLPIRAIGAAYLGGTRLRDVVLATGADEHRPGALAAADLLLRMPDEPWCSTDF